MSWATCYNGSNNIHFNIPPSMSDGRLFSNYEAACKANNQLKKNLGITNNYQYRQYLIHNGNQVAQKNSQLACAECSQCIKEAQQAPKTQKYLYKSCADRSRPYGYENSNLKNMYVSRQAQNSKLQAPLLTQEQLLLSRASKCSVGTADSAGPMKSCSSNKFD